MQMTGNVDIFTVQNANTVTENSYVELIFDC